MKPSHACTLAAAALASSASAVTHTFDFDAFASGTQANTITQPAGLDVTFHNAYFGPDIDPITLEPIPGTERWRVDDTAPPVVIDNPETYGRGPAPSPLNALECLFQPVLVNFTNPFNFDADGFRAVLDNDPFGFNGFLPGFGDIAVLFLASSGAEIARLQVDQTTPGFQVSGGGYQNVASLLLPGGAFYDNIFFSGVAVPAPGAASLLALAGAGAAFRRRR